MASLTVMVDDGQPSQLPSSRRWTTPSGSTPSSSTPPACDPQVGADLVEGLDHPGLGVLGMEAVEDEQAGDQLVLHRPVHGLWAGQLNRLPLQAGPVQLDHQPHDLLGDLGGAGVGGADLAEQLLDPRPDRRRSLPLTRPHGRPLPLVSIVGECSFFTTLPLPRYMWTPQGRHGSKLRTARMMSMPLNFSGGFSSKIGVFWTASS